MNEINIPSNYVPLPDEILEKLNEAKDNITILQGEGKRLSKLNRSLSKDIEDATNRKVQADKDEQEAKARVASLTAAELTALEAKAKAEASFADINARLSDAVSKLADTKSSQDSADASIQARIAVLNSRSESLDSREKGIASKETELSQIKTVIIGLLQKF